jgi:hypothetical protein
MDDFNQVGQNGIWGRLENAVLALLCPDEVRIQFVSRIPVGEPSDEGAGMIGAMAGPFQGR